MGSDRCGLAGLPGKAVEPRRWCAVENSHIDGETPPNRVRPQRECRPFGGEPFRDAGRAAVVDVRIAAPCRPDRGGRVAEDGPDARQRSGDGVLGVRRCGVGIVEQDRCGSPPSRQDRDRVAHLVGPQPAQPIRRIGP